MRVRELGRGGPPVTGLGLGLAALGRPGYMTVGHAGDVGEDISPEAMARRCHQVLDAAFAAGIRYFDVARSYGRGEEFLAGWLVARGIAPGTVTIGSKWGYTYTAGWQRDAGVHEVKTHDLDTFRRQWDETQALLGEHLSVYLIHSATLDSGVLERPAVLDAMQKARAQSGVRIGLSLSSHRQPEILRRALDLGIFDVVQATWNVLEPSAGPALAEARAQGMGVIVKEALANGRLTPRSPDLAARVAGGTAALDAIAISAALQQPFADVVLLGAATVAQLRSNLGARGLAPPDLSAWAEPPRDYWARRKTLPWT